MDLSLTADLREPAAGPGTYVAKAAAVRVLTCLWPRIRRYRRQDQVRTSGTGPPSGYWPVSDCRSVGTGGKTRYVPPERRRHQGMDLSLTPDSSTPGARPGTNVAKAATVRVLTCLWPRIGRRRGQDQVRTSGTGPPSGYGPVSDPGFADTDGKTRYVPPERRRPQGIGL